MGLEILKTKRPGKKEALDVGLLLQNTLLDLILYKGL